MTTENNLTVFILNSGFEDENLRFYSCKIHFSFWALGQGEWQLSRLSGGTVLMGRLVCARAWHTPSPIHLSSPPPNSKSQIFTFHIDKSKSEVLMIHIIKNR